MRRFLETVRIPVLFTALSFALLHCAGADEGAARRLSTKKPPTSSIETPKSANLGDDDDDTTKPAGPVVKPRVEPVLTFAFDGSTSLRARIKADKLPAGGSIATGVFPAEHFEDRSTVDCDALKANGTIDVAEAKTEGAYAFADVETNIGALTQRLDGFTRTVLQGCLFDAKGAVVAKISTSLMNAWDTVSGKASPPVFHGVEAYTNSCLDELGENPMFGDGEQTFDCTKTPGMEIVPITATATDGTVTTIDKTTTNWPLTSAQQAATRQCDRPAWLTYGSQAQCAPFTRIGRYTNSKGTNYVVICRRESVKPIDDPNFDIVGVIAHNPTSGKTCFFNNHLDGTPTDGTKIPPPNMPTSDRYWMDYGAIKDQACATCHDADPYIHTPWMDGALDAKKHAIVPKIGEDPAYTLTTKYSLHAAESFMHDAKSRQDWAQPEHLTNAGSCGSCHRIGTRGSSEFLSAMSVGDQRTLQQFGVWTTTTPAFRTQAKLHPGGAVQDTAPLTTINSCGQNPSRCQSTEIPH